MAIFHQTAEAIRRDLAATGRRPCWINLDETAIFRSFHGAQGNIVFGRDWVARAGGRLGAQVLRADIRGCATHVGLIADCADVNALLPQVFLGNTRVFTRAFVAEQVAHPPDGVRFWREKTSWNCAGVMCRIIDAVADAIAPCNVAAVLVMDTVSCHLKTEVLWRARARRLRILMVPARCTHILQPLDTHAFAGYKRVLKDAYRRVLASGDGFTPARWAAVLRASGVGFLRSRSWTAAFRHAGLGAERPLVLQGRLYPTSAQLARTLPAGRIDASQYAALIGRPFFV